MRHTPGPWMIEAGHNNYYIVTGTARLCGYIQRGADAELIAAAPELLKAAHAAFHALKSYEFGNSSPDLARSVAAALEDAIEKAEPDEGEPTTSIVARALKNAIENGCEDELATLSDEDVAYDLARHDTCCERLPMDDLIAGVRAWRAQRAADEDRCEGCGRSFDATVQKCITLDGVELCLSCYNEVPVSKVSE